MTTTDRGRDERCRYFVDEFHQALADPRSAGPAGHVGREPLDCAADPAGRQPWREPRQGRVEREDLGRPGDALEREDERQQEPDVDVHRPARVAQDHEPRLVQGASAPRERQHLAVRCRRRAETAPEVGQAAAANGHQPAAPSRGPARREPGEQALHVREVAVGAFLERLPPEDDISRVTGRAVLGRRLPAFAIGQDAGAAVRSTARNRAACGPALDWFAKLRLGLSQRPEPSEERLERCPIARPDLERDLKRALDLLAIEQIDQRQRSCGIDLVADADIDPRGRAAPPQSAPGER